MLERRRWLPKWGPCPPLTYLCWATHTLIDFGAGMLGGVVRSSKRAAAAAATAADKKSPNWVSKFIALSNYSEQFISHVPSQCNIIAPVMSTMVSIQIFLVTVLYCTIVHKCCAGAVDPHSFFVDPDPTVFLTDNPDPQTWLLPVWFRFCVGQNKQYRYG